jgi:hypothetical protein
MESLNKETGVNGLEVNVLSWWRVRAIRRARCAHGVGSQRVVLRAGTMRGVRGLSRARAVQHVAHRP